MQVITANAFASGEVIYWAKQGWVDDLRLAETLTDDAEIARILMAAEAMADKIVGAYAIEVMASDGGISPIKYREKIRASGPTNYRHGKLAEGVIGHVSL